MRDVISIFEQISKLRGFVLCEEADRDGKREGCFQLLALLALVFKCAAKRIYIFLTELLLALGLTQQAREHPL